MVHTLTSPSLLRSAQLSPGPGYCIWKCLVDTMPLLAENICPNYREECHIVETQGLQVGQMFSNLDLPLASVSIWEHLQTSLKLIFLSPKWRNNL